MPYSLLDRSTIVLAFYAAILTVTTASEASDGDLRKIDDLCVAAKRDRDLGKYEEVERGRRKRWELIEGLAQSENQVESTWLSGFRAIRDVDGDENTAAENLKDPGLVNRLKYKEACTRLRDAWSQMTRATDGPVLGEVAVRLFEVAQQSRGVYRDALDPNSSNCVATVAELKSVLAEAEKRDPFCVMATPLLHFLAEPDPKEAFLRAENRKSFRQRQSELVAISHPAVFLKEKTHEVHVKKATLTDDIDKGNGGDGEKVTISENAEKPLLPWHAAVELDKATSLQHLLEELAYGTYLKPDVPGPGYILPGKYVAGRDRMSDRFVLLYGRYLFCRVEDREGALRAAVLYLDNDHQWRRRYLNLLYRTPKKDDQHPLSELVESMPARHEFKLAESTYSIRDFPIESCEELVTTQTQVLCVKNASQLARFRYHPTRNDVHALNKQLSPRRKDPNDIQTTPAVTDMLQSLSEKGDITKHPLNELMDVFNPLVVVSDGDNAEVAPQFFAEKTQAPYLLLDDGHRLEFELSETEGAPRCSIKYPGATVSMPLHFHSVPKNLLKGGRMGSAFFRLLTDAGYTEIGAFNEIQACIEDPAHVPNKFNQRLRAKVVSTQTNQVEATIEMLKEAGWDGDPILVREMSRLYSIYGFRYLRDQRGNWITSRGFSEDQGVNGGNGPVGEARSSADDEDAALPPFDFRAQDGIARIDTTQIYARADYKQIKESIVEEHLKRLLRFHPAIPVVDMIRADEERDLLDLSIYDVVERKTKQLEASNSGNKTMALLKEDIEPLYAPFATWGTNGDALQAQSLDALHNAYVNRVKRFAYATYDVQQYPMRYDTLFELEKVGYVDQDLSARLGKIRRMLAEGYSSGQSQWLSEASPVLAVQLESARFFAKARLYHKSVLHYNDLLQQILMPQHRKEGHELFQRVVTAEDAQKFGAGIEKVIRSQQMILTAQMELAGVLSAAGLKDSAYFVWRRVADDEKYLLQPTAEIVQDIIESYGLRTSDRVSAALSAYRDTALTAEQAIRRHCTEPPWRVCVDFDLAKKKDVTSALVVIKTHLSRLQPVGKLGVDSRIRPEEERQFDRAMERVDEAEAIDFETWLRYRQALLPRGEVFALRSRGDRDDYLIHPVQFCPRSYTRDSGFTRPFSGMLNNTSPAEIRDWCALGDKEALESPVAEKACFLLGWYWLDEGKKTNARAAFMKLADVFLLRAEQARVPEDRLTQRLCALSAILGGYSIVDEVPGVKVIRSGLSAYMIPQLVHLERQWFSAGQYGPHAASECRVLERHVEAIQDHALQINTSERTGRYFLADYTYTYGAVPDWLVVQAITRPELFFQNLTAEKIEELKANAVEGKRWVLLDEKDAEHFFENLKLDTSVHEDIVNLAK